MAQKRHVYRPPTGRFSGVFAILGGILATLCVFVAIPLSQKLADMTTPAPVVLPEPEAAPPPEQELLVEQPPEEEIEEEPPPPPPEASPDLDLALDLGDLSVGSGGGFVMEIPKFLTKGGDDPFGSGDLDSPPEPFAKTQPVYPRRLLSQGKGGKVLVAVIVDEGGRVISTKVRESSGYPELDDAALKAVRRWKFKPAVRGGRKTKATAVVPFNFEVKR